MQVAHQHLHPPPSSAGFSAPPSWVSSRTTAPSSMAVGPIGSLEAANASRTAAPSSIAMVPAGSEAALAGGATGLESIGAARGAGGEGGPIAGDPAGAPQRSYMRIAGVSGSGTASAASASAVVGSSPAGALQQGGAAATGAAGSAAGDTPFAERMGGEACVFP
jgi:hypothetical protein